MRNITHVLLVTLCAATLFACSNRRTEPTPGTDAGSVDAPFFDRGAAMDGTVGTDTNGTDTNGTDTVVGMDVPVGMDAGPGEDVPGMDTTVPDAGGDRCGLAGDWRISEDPALCKIPPLTCTVTPSGTDYSLACGIGNGSCTPNADCTQCNGSIEALGMTNSFDWNLSVGTAQLVLGGMTCPVNVDR